MGHKQEADVDSRIEADHTTLEGARSAAIAYWKDGSGDRKLFRGSFGLVRYCGGIASAPRIDTV
jgi:hypothetical protein